MLGNLILLLLSFALLRILKYPMDALGLKPNRIRVLLLLSSLGLGLLLASIYFGLQIGLSNSTWEWNPEFTFTTFLQSLGWVFNSVLFEELIFRGLPLLLLYHYLGIRKACLLAGLIFGMYHWFSYGLIGQWVPMAYILLLTGTAGWAFAYGYLKTGSLYLPIGLHLGWNTTTIILFSQGPLGDQLLLTEAGTPLGTLTSILLFLFQVAALPLAVTLLTRIFRRQLAQLGISLP